VVKNQDILVHALLAGAPADQIKDRTAQLEARQIQLEQKLAKDPSSDATLRIHPKMSDTFHTRIKALIARLTEPKNTMEAQEKIRNLFEKIVITPAPTGGKCMEPRLRLRSALAGILMLSFEHNGKPAQQKNHLRTDGC
jgi:site-specific DNA recombinase